MTRSQKPPAPETASYHGEIWTDARGYATIRLPSEAPPLEYELRDLEPATSARVTAELRDGQFRIRTDEPHVKVAWRLTAQTGAGARASVRGRT